MGGTWQVAPTGNPVQAKLTVPMNEGSGVSRRLKVAVAPGETVAEVLPLGAAEIEAAGVALPLTAITCGEAGASSESVMVSLRWPAASGAKVTEMAQEALGARAATQLLGGLVKSAGLFPPTTTAEMCRVALPELVMVMVTGALAVPWGMAGKVTGLGERVMAGAGGGAATAVPVRETDCGLSGALSVMRREACAEPGEAGEKVILTEQKFLGCRTVGA